jgi:hypothetical protein
MDLCVASLACFSLIFSFYYLLAFFFSSGGDRVHQGDHVDAASAGPGCKKV